MSFHSRWRSARGAFCFSRVGLLKAGDQGLIKDSARFGLLVGLELRHSQVEKRIGVEIIVDARAKLRTGH